MIQRLTRLKLPWAALLMALTCLNGSAIRGQTAGDSLVEVSRQAWDLAGQGKLEEAIQQVKQVARVTPGQGPLSALRGDIELRETHLHQRHTQAAEEYGKKMQELAGHLEQGRLVRALSAALEANDLAPDPQAVLAEAAVRRLIEQAERKAAEHEKAGQWVKSLTLYRQLASLYDKTDQDRYEAVLKRVARRVGLLRLYAPDVLFEMYKQNALDEGEPAPEPWYKEETKWQTQLEGITRTMLGESLILAARHHVEDPRYERLCLGGLESLELLLTLKGMEAAFPSLGDEQKVGPLREFIKAAREQIGQRKTPMGITEAIMLVERLVKKNQETVALPEAVVVHEFGIGATGTLDDFSGIIWPHDKAMFDRTTTQKLSGVGIQIGLVDRKLTVISPLEGSPALAAGIHPGDRIVSIDGKATSGIDLDTAVDKITGPEGTKVTLGIQSPGEQTPRQVPLTRASIKIVSIKGWSRQAGGQWEYYIDPRLRIGYVRMTSFGPDTAAELDAAVRQMQQQGSVKGLILDLRNNPGGRLDAAVEVADRFLNEGVIVSTTQKLITGQPWQARAEEKGTYPAFPVVVLINRFSASASEIVSGALKDHHRALILGQRTFGKGSVQNIFQIGQQAAYLKLTTQYYKLPDGRIIHRRSGQDQWGVDPDVAVPMSGRQMMKANRDRTYLDILRQNGDKVDRSAVLSPARRGESPESRDEPDGPAAETAQDLLKLGIDPQLEAAMLLMKVRVIGEAQG